MGVMVERTLDLTCPIDLLFHYISRLVTWCDYRSSSWLTAPGLRVTIGVMEERTSDLICPINLCFIIFLDW